MRNILFVVAMSVVAATYGSKVPAVETDQEVFEMQEVLVVEEAAPSAVYLAPESTVGSKIPLGFLDNPQSVQVLTQELIKDQAALQITDLYRSISGVTEFSYSGVTFRGFRQDNVLYDGVRGDPYGGFAVPQLFNIERVEVLKGPSGMLYGGGEPGGLLNYITKKPEFEAWRNITAFGGNYDRYGFSSELTGPIAGLDRIAYRLGVFYEDRDYFRNNADGKNLHLASGLAFKLTESTDLNLSFEYIKHDLGGHRLRGVPVGNNGNFLTDISFTTNEKSDFQNLRARVAQATIDHRFTDDLKVRLVLRQLGNRRSQEYHEPRGLGADGRTMQREFRDQSRQNAESSLTSDVTYSTRLAGMRHTWLVGADYFKLRNKYRTRSARGGVPNIDILNPRYGLSDPAKMVILSRQSKNRARRAGFYLQDKADITDRLSVIAGFRYDTFKDKNNINGRAFSDSAITPRVGLLFRLRPDTSLWFSYARGFNPQTISNQEKVSADAGKLKPEESSSLEGGIKAEAGDLQLAAAGYQIVKRNVSVANPADTGRNDGIPDLIQIGEATSLGFEFDVVGKVTDNLTITANYAYNHVKITSGNPGQLRNSIGTKFANAPKHTFGFWGSYDFPRIHSALSFGVDYIYDRVSLSGQKVRQAAVFDAGWRTGFGGGWLFTVNAKNLFNKKYAKSGFMKRSGHFPGEPLTVLTSLSYQF